jgi:endonuclease III
MNAETRSEIFSRLLKKIPEPTTELNYSTPFELLVAVTLSAQRNIIPEYQINSKMTLQGLL